MENDNGTRIYEILDKNVFGLQNLWTSKQIALIGYGFNLLYKTTQIQCTLRKKDLCLHVLERKIVYKYYLDYLDLFHLQLTL